MPSPDAANRHECVECGRVVWSPEPNYGDFICGPHDRQTPGATGGSEPGAGSAPPASAASTRVGGRSVTRVVQAAYVVIAARGTHMEDDALDALEQALRDLYSLGEEHRDQD